jgi:mono/diheme cytochrome c family protein
LFWLLKKDVMPLHGFNRRYQSRNLAPISLMIIFFGLAIPVFASDWQKKVPEADRSATNPVANDPTAVTAGGQTYEQKCAKCHGPNGEGKGHHPALRSQKMQDATPGEIHWIITHGTAMHGMPGFGKLSDSERWQLVSYIKSLQGASAGQSPNSK